MTKNFKMGVISLSFLIGGGILFGFGIKNSKTEKNNKKIKKERTELDGYKFNIPSIFRLTTASKSSYTFTNLVDTNKTIAMSINSYEDDFERIGEAELREAAEIWIQNEKEKDYNYLNGGVYKASYCHADWPYLDAIVYTVIDRSNIIQVVYIITKSKEIEQDKEQIASIMDEFVLLNY